ncbi:MAG: alpha/beta hydrolase [Lachnospiraceae bacterium]|nr:alpha/beta hydrolase [Lachnospiraceae bacterium]
MKKEAMKLWNPEEYTYPLAFGFIPNIVPYIHEEDDEVRPCMIVVPGGGYCVVSPTEAEIVAKVFYEMGYQAFVLTYTTNRLMREPLKDQPMKDLSRAIRYVRKHAEEFRIRPDQVAICGFSAGGHLSASVCVYHMNVAEENPEYSGYSNRPDAAILSYPVITCGKYAHKGSFEALLGPEGEPGSKQAEAWEKMSLENHVTPATPPCFLWQTATDELVPVENSYFFAMACKDAGVPFAHHVFTEGAHGLSLANEDWEDGRFGTWYTAEQDYCLVDAIRKGLIEVDEEQKKWLFLQFDGSERDLGRDGRKGNTEVQVWPWLAGRWLEEIWKKQENN